MSIKILSHTIECVNRQFIVCSTAFLINLDWIYEVILLDDIRKVFGERVRELREKIGLTQEQLAERADLHPNYVGEIERGNKNASLVIIKKIADGLRVELNTLFDGERKELSLHKTQIHVLLKQCSEEELAFLYQHLEHLLRWREDRR